jgi:tRNA pseudouridine32 synthase/23S rRNA pseudouridine746 synthase
LSYPIPSPDQVFIPFENATDNVPLPAGFHSPFALQPQPLGLEAASHLQTFLSRQQEWRHNFGLQTGVEGPVIGKMFGVLAVRTNTNEIGYLAAFSGKLAGSNHHTGFVPPIFDSLDPGSFLNSGMLQLGRINAKIKALETTQGEVQEQLHILKTERKEHSYALQQKLHGQYAFMNQAGITKSLPELFQAAGYKNPPAGAGECAAPKLLQYAFLHQMQPLAIAEFWWGLSPKSDYWKHGHYYPACEEKCRPILNHMLSGMDIL